MLFISPPTHAELTSYNEIKYKSNVEIAYSVTLKNYNTLLLCKSSENDLLFFDNKSNIVSADLHIINEDFEISNSSTWDFNIEDIDIDTLDKRLLINKTIKIKSKIIKINHFQPQIVLD